MAPYGSALASSISTLILNDEVRLLRRSGRRPAKLGILAGSFNPPTVAHLELAHAAAAHVDEVLCVLPRELPHKPYFGATLEQRVELIEAAGLPAAHAIGIADRGLFIEIAHECREHYGAEAGLYFICGRDAAERVIGWDYGKPGIHEEMLAEFDLLVAPRQGGYEPPPEWSGRVHELRVREDIGEVSSTEVRARIERGEPWEHLVPAAIAERVLRIYS
jgi:nicotinate (nicotinamide) nucleotide adenylyltransferase